MGGSDSTENIVHLTPEEHYVAHQLLVKIHPTNQSLIYAANMMCSANDTHRQDGQGRNNKLYGWLKRRLSLAAHQRTGSKNGSYGKYWYHNPISNEAGKFLPGAEPAGWCIGRVPLRKCITCGSQASSKNAKYCQTCKPKPTGHAKTVYRQPKQQGSYSVEDKIAALIANNGNIRRALYSLGLNDSGGHYKLMCRLKQNLLTKQNTS